MTDKTFILIEYFIFPMYQNEFSLFHPISPLVGFLSKLMVSSYTQLPKLETVIIISLSLKISLVTNAFYSVTPATLPNVTINSHQNDTVVSQYSLHMFYIFVKLFLTVPPWDLLSTLQLEYLFKIQIWSQKEKVDLMLLFSHCLIFLDCIHYLH